MRYSPINPTLFEDRRNAFANKMRDGSIAILYSHDHMRRSGDQFYPYRQNSSLFALTGIDQPGTILIIFPSARKKSHREILFILPHDPLNAIWNGERLTTKAAASISSINNVITVDKFETTIQTLLKRTSALYIDMNAGKKNSAQKQSAHPKQLNFLKEEYPDLTFYDAHELLTKIRMVKHPFEIKLLKKAIDVTANAFDSVLKTSLPGKKEYEIEAELTYVLTKSGCQHAFEPIVASGKSACILHYTTNDQIILADSMILLDFGVEYANMCSDMTRTIPASGRFSKQQKKIYTAVLHVLNTIMSMMAPGVTLDELNKEAGKMIESELLKLKIISKKEVSQQDKKSPAWKKYFMHGIGHHLGYDVHDLSDRKAVLKPGMVLTCEPGLYIPEMDLGIRLENDVLITKKGSENLMRHIPIDPDEIESIMQSKT